MIANPERTVVLSSLGWVDGDAIWCLDVASGQARTIPQNTGARCTSLHMSGTERFVAVHHFDGARSCSGDVVVVDEQLKIRRSANLA